VEKEKPLECSVDEGWEYKRVEKPMDMSICYKGLGDSNQSANIVKKRKCSIDEGLNTRGWRKVMAICMYYKGLGENLSRDN